jgi:FtsX-like permease family
VGRFRPEWYDHNRECGASTLVEKTATGLTVDMSPILYRLRQRLRHHRGSTALFTVVVAVVLGLTLTLVAGALRTLSAPDRYSSAFGGDYDISFFRNDPVPSGADLSAVPAVRSIASATFVFGVLTAESDAEPVEAITFIGQQDAFGTRMVDGREPDPDNPTEFVASRSFVEQNGSRVGDSFAFAALTQEQADSTGFDSAEWDGPTESATLVGVFDGAADLQDGYAVALFPPTLLDLGDIGLSGTAGVIGLSPESTIDDLRAQLDALTNGTDVAISPLQLVPDTVRSGVRAEAQGIGVLALFAAGAAVVVLGQLLGRQHRLSDDERLALRSIGMTDRQLVIDPLGRAAVPIIFGGLAAVPIAIVCSRLFPRGFVVQVEPHLGTRFDPLVHLLGPIVLITLVLVWVATGFALADRSRAPSATSAAVDRIAGRLAPVQLATGLRFAFSGARNRRWPAASFAGLVVVVGVVVGALTLGANIEDLTTDAARYGGLELGIGSGGDQIPDPVRTVLEGDPDVSAVTYYGGITVQVGSISLDVTGLQPEKGDLLPHVLSGRLPQSDDEILLGKVAARELGVGIGDSIDASGPSGVQHLRVTGLGVNPGADGADGLGEGGIVTAGGLRQISPDTAFSTAAIALRPGAPANTVERLSNLIGMGIGPFDRPSVILNIGRVSSIPFLVAAVLAAFAVLSLTNELMTSARHRRRDIAILKSLGGNRVFVSQVVHVQATLFTAGILAVALPIGVIAGRSVYGIITDRIGARTDVTTPMALLALTIVAPMLLANVVAGLPARRARRLEPATQLHEE